MSETSYEDNIPNSILQISTTFFKLNDPWKSTSKTDNQFFPIGAGPFKIEIIIYQKYENPLQEHNKKSNFPN